MSKDYTGHTADEVRDLVRMCASQYDIHSADEWMSIMRKAHALLQNDSAEIEQLKEALAVSRHETGTVDNALYKYEVLWSACKGWREFDWPEGFSRRTADLIVENAERVLASTGRKEPELTKDKISMKYRLLTAGS